MKLLKTLTFVLAVIICKIAVMARGSETVSMQPFTGEKTSWHGFDRYDFFMGDDLVPEPTKATADEGNGFKHQDGKGRRCIIVVPKAAAPGNPWSWRGCYWDHQPQTEVELLKRGFCIGYVEAGQDLRPDKTWDAWYAFLTQKHGLSAKPAFIGMSRGGEFAYTWAVRNPDKVSCIYADNPGGNWEVFNKLSGLASNDVPVLHVCGSFDPILGKFTLPIENIYHQFGGRISVMIKEGRGHHPHSLRDPKPIADFIERSVKETRPTPPDFAGNKFTRTTYYSLAGSYENFPSEQTYLTLRGPLFAPCYERYQIDLPKVEAFTTIIAPLTPAPGNPWVFRADLVTRDDVVAQALLAKGFYIVTGSIPYNSDGLVVEQWNTIYQHLVSHGFSKKPVISGAGGAAGEAYAWAIENPDKVACIYAENPVLHSNTAKTQPLDNLAPLAKAGVPILHVCGSDDPWLEKNTRVAREEYQKLGRQMKVIVEPGRGHSPPTPEDSPFAVDFIMQAMH
jgi:pimeloyl-ACP methyl ester carboxylesterase